MTRLDYRSVARFLSGRSTPEEQRRMEAWLAEDPEHRRLFERVRQIWHLAEAPGMSRPPNEDFVSEDWERLRAAMRSSPAPSLPPDREAKRRAADRTPRAQHGRGTSRLARVAAVLVVLFGSIWLVTRHVHRGADLPPTPAVQEIEAQPGQHARIRLDDGTLVRLNVSSKIQFPKQFTGDRREVTLVGEAFFEVREDAARPFIVRAENAVVQVLGTAFNVRAYEEEHRVDVVVVQGKVALQAAQANDVEAVILTPQQMGRLASGHAERLASGIDVQRHLAWLESRLVFEDTPLRDVAIELQRWYTLEVTVADPQVAGWRLTATFKNESINEVLDVIAASLGVRYERDQQTVTFYR